MGMEGAPTNREDSGVPAFESGPEELREVIVRDALARALPEAVLSLEREEDFDAFLQAATDADAAEYRPHPDRLDREALDALKAKDQAALRDRMVAEWSRGDDTLLLATLMRGESSLSHGLRTRERLQERHGPLADDALSPELRGRVDDAAARQEIETNVLRALLARSPRYGGIATREDLLKWVEEQEEEFRSWSAAGRVSDETTGEAIPGVEEPYNLAEGLEDDIGGAVGSVEDTDDYRVLDRILVGTPARGDGARLARRIDETITGVSWGGDRAYVRLLLGDESAREEIAGRTATLAHLYRLRDIAPDIELPHTSA